MSLSPQQIRSAELLAKGHSQEAVGNAVGVSRRTIARWLRREDFRNLSFGLLGRAAQSPQQAPQRSPESRKQSNELTPQDLVGDALEAVRSILQDPDSRNADRLKAASLVGEWTGLGVRGKMAEMEALKVLIEADWIDDAAINTLLENWQILSAEMKDVLRGK
jgi:transcriptional regulator with XRE-family HTH domain